MIDYLVEVFNRQRVLMDNFHKVEMTNRAELRNSPTLEKHQLETVFGQLRVKEYAWRITEEIGEALAEKDLDKYYEEIADAFHFLIEMYLLVGIRPQDFDRTPTADGLSTAYFLVEQIEEESRDNLTSSWEYWMFFIKDLAQTMNLLKNRPWRVRFTNLDYVVFEEKMLATFYSFTRACMMTGVNRDILFENYMKKNKTNLNRLAEGR